MPSVLRKCSDLVGDRRWPWVLVVVLALAVSAFEAGGAVLLYGLLGLVAGDPSSAPLPLVGDVTPHLAGWGLRELYVAAAALISGFFVIRGVVVVVQAYVLGRVTETAGNRVATRVHRGFLSAPYSSRGEEDTARHIRNAHDTIQRLIDGFLVPAVTLVSEFVVILVLLIVLVVTAPMATLLVVLVVLPVVVVLNRTVQPRLEALGRRYEQLSTDSLRVLRETVDGADEIRVTGGAPYFSTRFTGIRGELARTGYMHSLLAKLPVVGLETALVLFLALFLAITVLSDGDVAQVLPVIGLFGYTGLRLIPSLERAVRSVNSMRFTAPAVDELHTAVERITPWLASDDADGQRLSLTDELRLEGVSLWYPGSSAPALDDVDVAIRRGSFVGLVGITGGGKSTLVDVIVGLRAPTSGRVRVDGHDIHTRLRAWQRSIGYVPQHVFLMDDTLRRNIALGIDDTRIDEQRLVDSVRLAQLDELVERLPEGLDTVAGERGTRLSGGQRQRVAIARALYRQPDLLVLDEGTAALDPSTERSLMRGLLDQTGLTIVLVAHRVASIRDCDVVHLVDRGRIATSGTYDELTDDQMFASFLRWSAQARAQAPARASTEAQASTEAAVGQLSPSDGQQQPRREQSDQREPHDSP